MLYQCKMCFHYPSQTTNNTVALFEQKEKSPGCTVGVHVYAPKVLCFPILYICFNYILVYRNALPVFTSHQYWKSKSDNHIVWFHKISILPPPPPNPYGRFIGLEPLPTPLEIPPLWKFQSSSILFFKNLCFSNLPPPWSFHRSSVGEGRWWIFSGTAHFLIFRCLTPLIGEEYYP